MKKYILGLVITIACVANLKAQQTQKPPLHGKDWVAITGKPLAATAGSMVFQKGGNAVDAACAMLAATCTMWDVLSWGGETQALIYNPKTKKVIAISAMGFAPTGATPAFFKGKGFNYPPEYGPLAATTPGTPGGICLMLANYGSMSLKEVLAPAMDLAAGYPIDAQTANSIERGKDKIKQWPYSTKVLLEWTINPNKVADVDDFEIYRRKQGQSFSLLTTLSNATSCLDDVAEEPDAN